MQKCTLNPCIRKDICTFGLLVANFIAKVSFTEFASMLRLSDVVVISPCPIAKDGTKARNNVMSFVIILFICQSTHIRLIVRFWECVWKKFNLSSTRMLVSLVLPSGRS